MIQHLRLRRQTVKLTLYCRFRAVFASSVLLGVAWAIYGIVQSSEAEEVNGKPGYILFSAAALEIFYCFVPCRAMPLFPIVMNWIGLHFRDILWRIRSSVSASRPKRQEEDDDEGQDPTRSVETRLM